MKRIQTSQDALATVLAAAASLPPSVDRTLRKLMRPPKGNTQRTYGKSFLQRVRDSKSAREAKEVYAQAERAERITPSTLRKIKKAINARVDAGTWR